MRIKELWFEHAAILELINDPTRTSWYSEASLECDHDHNHKLTIVNGDYVKSLEAKNGELEKKLEISAACLRELRPVIELGEDWELGKWIDEALAAIKGASNE